MTDKHEFKFDVREGDTLTLKAAVYQALGAASMAWSEVSKGVFDDTYATSIGEELIRFLTQGKIQQMVNGKMQWVDPPETLEE